MQITLYLRSYPVAGAPIALSLVPYPAAQRHTFTDGGRVYEAELREFRVVVPDDAKIDLLKNLFCWAGDEGPVRSTATEVFDLAESRASGFRLADVKTFTPSMRGRPPAGKKKSRPATGAGRRK